MDRKYNTVRQAVIAAIENGVSKEALLSRVPIRRSMVWDNAVNEWYSYLSPPAREAYRHDTLREI